MKTYYIVRLLPLLLSIFFLTGCDKELPSINYFSLYDSHWNGSPNILNRANSINYHVSDNSWYVLYTDDFNGYIQRIVAGNNSPKEMTSSELDVYDSFNRNDTIFGYLEYSDYFKDKFKTDYANTKETQFVFTKGGGAYSFDHLDDLNSNETEIELYYNNEKRTSLSNTMQSLRKVLNTPILGKVVRKIDEKVLGAHLDKDKLIVFSNINETLREGNTVLTETWYLSIYSLGISDTTKSSLVLKKFDNNKNQAYSSRHYFDTNPIIKKGKDNDLYRLHRYYDKDKYYIYLERCSLEGNTNGEKFEIDRSTISHGELKLSTLEVMNTSLSGYHVVDYEIIDADRVLFLVWNSTSGATNGVYQLIIGKLDITAAADNKMEISLIHRTGLDEFNNHWTSNFKVPHPTINRIGNDYFICGSTEAPGSDGNIFYIEKRTITNNRINDNSWSKYKTKLYPYVPDNAVRIFGNGNGYDVIGTHKFGASEHRRIARFKLDTNGELQLSN